MKYTIIFNLRSNRMLPGKAEIVDSDGTVVVGPWPCLGCCDAAAAAAHGNPECDVLKPWGNTPTGIYGVEMLIYHGVGELNEHSYGPCEALALSGISGDAFKATSGRVPVRNGLEAHGGDLGPTGCLRVTHGCLRSSNSDQRAMVDFIKTKGTRNFIVRVTES